MKNFESILNDLEQQIVALKEAKEAFEEQQQKSLATFARRVKHIWKSTKYTNLQKYNLISDLVLRTHEAWFGRVDRIYTLGSDNCYYFFSPKKYDLQGWEKKKEQTQKAVVFLKTLLWLRENDFPIFAGANSISGELLVKADKERVVYYFWGEYKKYTLEQLLEEAKKENKRAREHIAWLNSTSA